MNWLRLQPVIICLVSGVLLGIANILLPYILSPVLAFALGVVAFARVFMAPGPLTLRRDLIMFGVVVGALIIARFTVQWGCEATFAIPARCTDRYLLSAEFVDIFVAAMPIVFLWSWVRFRLLRLWLAERRER
jgi:hypothetical protein